MRTHRAAVCLAAATLLLVAGCSDSEDDSDAAGGGSSRSQAAPEQEDSQVTVELRVTGDSPASLYIPGIKYQAGDDPSGDHDLDLDSVKTPWSKKFKFEPGRSLSLQVASKEPKKEIGCQILVDGEVKAEELKKNKPGYTLNTTCTTTS
ncbi:MmpS family transport accessory protein [Streptomyces sp. CA-250714]|uniref:MmpS family transport accessory protein n=1 Tax=Streptomyces sp. CA-250714 TaxID=3240060 RepID=UPI003D8D4F70